MSCVSGVVAKAEESFGKASAALLDRTFRKPLSIQQKLAVACRILGTNGQGGTITGQVTARGEQVGTMWTQRFGIGVEEMLPSDYMLVDGELNVIEGEGMPNPANQFHLAVYEKRPDIQAIIHTHSKHCSALSMLGKPLEISHMDSAMLYERVAHLPTWPGTPFGYDEGELISNSLGDKQGILLAHHGQLSSGHCIEQATVFALTMEWAAEVQLAATAAGNIQSIDPGLAREACHFLNSTGVCESMFAYHARMAIRSDPAAAEALGCIAHHVAARI